MEINLVSQGSSYLASHRVRVVPARDSMKTSKISEKGDPNADVNIFYKHFDPDGNIQFAIDNHDKKTKIIFDICDDHFDRQAGPYYKRMVDLADHITCNSPQMKKRIHEVTNRPLKDITVITDPVSFPLREPEHNPRSELLWFGHASNLESLNSWLPKIQDHGILTIITNTNVQGALNIRPIAWYPGVVEEKIKDFDIVLIPVTKTPWSKYKSPNRAVDAIQSGKFVITDSEDVYGDLKDFLYITDDPMEGIRFYNDNPEKVKEMILKGQEYIQKKHSIETVEDQWRKVIEKVSS
jgi:hypothetical protein